MKKTLLMMAAFALCMAAVSCNKDSKEGEEEQAASIALYSPDDLEEFDLDYENQTKSLTFEWESLLKPLK